jgi:hypothetical protein
MITGRVHRALPDDRLVWHRNAERRRAGILMVGESMGEGSSLLQRDDNTDDDDDLGMSMGSAPTMAYAQDRASIAVGRV